MALFRTFKLDGVSSGNYGLYISGAGVYNAPERKMSLYAIPGKNGSLAIDEGAFGNIEVEYPAAIVSDSQEDFAEKLIAARNWLASKHYYVRLEDDYHPDEYRQAIFKDGLDVGPVVYNHAGSFKIVFNCKPQRFLTSGEDPWVEATDYTALMDEDSVNLQDENGDDIEGAVTLNTTITNPTAWAARPLIRATGSGTISIGSQTITIGGISESTNIYIDCESMEIYTLSGSTPVSAAKYVSFSGNSFPVINPGSNAIVHTMPIQIIPRWWRL